MWVSSQTWVAEQQQTDGQWWWWWWRWRSLLGLRVSLVFQACSHQHEDTVSVVLLGRLQRRSWPGQTGSPSWPCGSSWRPSHSAAPGSTGRPSSWSAARVLLASSCDTKPNTRNVRNIKNAAPRTSSPVASHNHAHTWSAYCTYRGPHVFFGSPILFSGTLLPPNHFLVAVKSDRLKPFLETSCKGRRKLLLDLQIGGKEPLAR